MRSRYLTARASWWLVPAVAALVVASALVVTAGDRVHLGADVLSQSRGGGTFSTLIHLSCDAYNGNFACGTIGAACVTCSTSTYTSPAGAAGGGYKHDPIAVLSCGNNLAGTCSTTFQCIPKANVGVCATPKKPAVQ
jgi:hypothetical protein